MLIVHSGWLYKVAMHLLTLRRFAFVITISRHWKHYSDLAHRHENIKASELIAYDMACLLQVISTLNGRPVLFGPFSCASGPVTDVLFVAYATSWRHSLNVTSELRTTP